MIFDAFAQYAQSLAAFWVSLASGGILKILMIWGIIYWIFCRRGRRRWRARWGHGCGCHGGMGWMGGGCGCHCGCSNDGCAHCDCTCGGCACRKSDAHADCCGGGAHDHDGHHDHGHAHDEAEHSAEGGADA